MSHVTYQVSGATRFFFYKVGKLVGGRSDINGAYPVYFMNKYKNPDTLAILDNYN